MPGAQRGEIGPKAYVWVEKASLLTRVNGVAAEKEPGTTSPG